MKLYLFFSFYAIYEIKLLDSSDILVINKSRLTEQTINHSNLECRSYKGMNKVIDLPNFSKCLIVSWGGPSYTSWPSWSMYNQLNISKIEYRGWWIDKIIVRPFSLRLLKEKGKM